MPAGDQASKPSEDDPRAGPRPETQRARAPRVVERASGAALVPSTAIVVHVLLLVATPTSSARLMPWPLEAAVVWLPWLSVCVWGALSARPGQRATRGLIAWGALGCSLHYLWAFRWTAARQQWSPERYASELAAFLSTTIGGAPWHALAYALGWTATAAVLGRVLTDVTSPWTEGSRTMRRLRSALIGVLFLLGSAAVLQYATGSPWPLL